MDFSKLLNFFQSSPPVINTTISTTTTTTVEQIHPTTFIQKDLGKLSISKGEKPLKSQTLCKYFPECKNVDCPYIHQKSSSYSSTSTFVGTPSQKNSQPTEPVQTTKTQIVCKFYPNCTKKDCPFLHQTSTKSADSKRLVEKVCRFWHTDRFCKFGSDCEYQHPPHIPTLDDILDYKGSISGKFDPSKQENHILPYGIIPIAGAKYRVMDNGLVICFIPFSRVFNGITYYKKIKLYRFNKTKQQYKMSFSYRVQDFHITTAAASNGLLVCSRLPFDADVLKLIEDHELLIKKHKKVKETNTKLYQKNGQLFAEKQTLAIENAQLKERNRKLFIQTRPPTPKISSESKLLAFSSARIFENIRDRDPVDILVYDDTAKTFVHVLEYHKPADHVHLDGKHLTLWDKNTKMSHKFDIKIHSSTVKNFNFTQPLQPKQLCVNF